MVSNNNNFPFLIFSSITEDTGHLILDDFFWFSNLIERFPNTRIITSETSAKNILVKYSDYKKNVTSFKDFPVLKKINYRLHLLGRLIFCEKIRNSRIIFQGFDELGLLFYLLKIWGKNNLLYVVPTNNVSPERLNKSKWILQWMLKKIINNSNFFLYHTDFEFRLIESEICNNTHALEKCKKLKYHLIGASQEKIHLEKNGENNIISFFGPTMQSKPYFDICKLIKADNYGNGKFEYRFINLSFQVLNEIQLLFGKADKIIFINEFLEHKLYINLIAQSTYIFLPHNHLYEGKLSGILSDCISVGTPIISNRIDPVLEFFNYYGDMGFIYDFSRDVDWEYSFLCQFEKINYKDFILSMEKCKSDHSPNKIIEEFLACH
jgi:hypothetical protein